MGLGQYNCLGEYCGPHTVSSVFLILVFFISIASVTISLFRLFQILHWTQFSQVPYIIYDVIPALIMVILL